MAWIFKSTVQATRVAWRAAVLATHSAVLVAAIIETIIIVVADG